MSFERSTETKDFLEHIAPETKIGLRTQSKFLSYTNLTIKKDIMKKKLVKRSLTCLR